MKTITFYKVVYVDQYGEVVDNDFQNETQARAYAGTVTNARIYRYKMLADVVDIT